MSPNYDWNNLPGISDFRIVNRAAECRDPVELEALSEHGDDNVRARVAENMYTPIWILEKLSRDTEFVQLYLIRNKVLPFSILKGLVDDKKLNIPKRLAITIYERIIVRYVDSVEEITSEELYKMLKILYPDKTNLQLIEWMEDLYVAKDKKSGKQ